MHHPGVVVVNVRRRRFVPHCPNNERAAEPPEKPASFQRALRVHATHHGLNVTDALTPQPPKRVRQHRYPGIRRRGDQLHNARRRSIAGTIYTEACRISDTCFKHL